MPQSSHSRSLPLALALALAGCGARAATCPPAAPHEAPAPAGADAPIAGGPCASAAHRGFDFWIGSWDVRKPDGTPAGHNQITTGHRGCVLTERWQGASGSTGTSLTFVDPATGEWVQHWLDSDGSEIVLRGGPDGGALVLTGTLVEPGPKRSRLRGTWTPLPDGRVRQRFDQSTDDGATWTLWFEGVYERAPG